MILVVELVGLLLSFARAIQKRNINYQQDLLVIANDISDVCAYMTYIQLSLYGIPAIVYCGDALSQKKRFKMETPLYFLQYWKFRNFNKQSFEKSTVKPNPIESFTDNSIKEVLIKGNYQISLW